MFGTTWYDSCVKNHTTTLPSPPLLARPSLAFLGPKATLSVPESHRRHVLSFYHSSRASVNMITASHILPLICPPHLLRIGEGELQRRESVHPAPERHLVVIARDHHHRPCPRRKAFHNRHQKVHLHVFA